MMLELARYLPLRNQSQHDVMVWWFRDDLGLEVDQLENAWQ